MAEKRMIEEPIYEYTKTQVGVKLVEKWFASDGKQCGSEYEARQHDINMAKEEAHRLQREKMNKIKSIKLDPYEFIGVENLRGIYYLTNDDDLNTVTPPGDCSLYIDDKEVTSIPYPAWYVVFFYDGGDYKDSVSVYPLSELEKDIDILTKVITEAKEWEESCGSVTLIAQGAGLENQ